MRHLQIHPLKIDCCTPLRNDGREGSSHKAQGSHHDISSCSDSCHSLRRSHPVWSVLGRANPAQVGVGDFDADNVRVSVKLGIKSTFPVQPKSARGTEFNLQGVPSSQSGMVM